jgi:CheY-like chemotaxis protein
MDLDPVLEAIHSPVLRTSKALKRNASPTWGLPGGDRYCQTVSSRPFRDSARGETIVKDPKRILIVDDEILNRCLLEAMLEPMGFQAQCASDGLEALECLSPEIDLILLDVMMPGLDGFEVARRIRCGDSCQNVPIIMVTGLSSAEDRMRAEEAGADAFVTKPIDQLELRVAITALLNSGETVHSPAR